VTNPTGQDRVSDPERGRGGRIAAGGYARRLSDKILVAFHQACDQHDFEVAERLLILQRRPLSVPNRRRHDMETLVAAHQRLWQRRHPGSVLAAMDRPALPPIPQRIGP